MLFILKSFHLRIIQFMLMSTKSMHDVYQFGTRMVKLHRNSFSFHFRCFVVKTKCGFEFFCAGSEPKI